MRKFIFTAIVLTALQALAQDSQVWSLEKCITYAMDNNLQLKQKRVNVKLSETDVEARKGALLPTVSFSTGQNGSWRPWSKSYVNITDGTMSSTSSELNYTGTYGVQAQWSVWNGGRNRKQLDRSRLSQKQSEVDVESTELSLQEQIVQYYVQILYQREAVEVNKQVLASTEVLCERAKTMYDVGQMSRADYAQMEAQVSQEKYNVANSTAQLRSTILALSQILQLPMDDNFDVAVPAITDDMLSAPIPSAVSVYEISRNLRPEIRYYRLGIEAADMDIDIARRGYYPTIGVSAGVNTNNSSGMNESFGTQLKNNLNNSLGLSISIPIFDGKQNSTNVAKAKLDRTNAELALELQEQQLYNDIETFYINALNATEQYSSALVSVASMRESYELVSEQFTVGIKDIVDLTTGKNNLLQAEQQLLQAKYTSILNRALLNFYQGAPFNI